MSYQNAECTGSGGAASVASDRCCGWHLCARDHSSPFEPNRWICVPTQQTVGNRQFCLLHTKWQIGGPCPPAPPDLFCASPGIVLAALLYIYHHSNDVFPTNYVPSSLPHPIHWLLFFTYRSDTRQVESSAMDDATVDPVGGEKRPRATGDDRTAGSTKHA